MRDKNDAGMKLLRRDIKAAYERLTGKPYPATAAGDRAARRWLWIGYGRRRIEAAIRA